MDVSEIQTGRKYWIKPSDDTAARPACVLKMSLTEPKWFLCAGANGESYLVHSEAFVRPVVPGSAGTSLPSPEQPTPIAVEEPNLT